MTPAAIIQQAAAGGVTLALTPAGTIKATGDGAAIKRWQAILRQHKPGIVAALQEAANDSARPVGVALTKAPFVDDAIERRRARAFAILNAEPSRRIAVVAETGDPARVMVAIRGIGSGEMDIPAHRYDVSGLLALMNRYATVCLKTAFVSQ